MITFNDNLCKVLKGRTHVKINTLVFNINDNYLTTKQYMLLILLGTIR